MPPSGMRRILFAVLLVTIALQESAATGGGWFSWLQGRLDVVQQQVQQRQAEYLQQQQLANAAGDGATVPAQRRLMQEVDTGNYGQGSYGYGSYGYGESNAGGSSSSNRRLLETPGLAPTLVYDDERIEQVRQIGEAHTDGIELEADVPALPPTLHERPVEIRAVRKLLLTASDINVAAIDQAIMPVAAVTLEPEDLLASHRSLLQDGELAGSYGGYGYGNGYGSYGAETTSGRSLLESGNVDDVQLYNIWLQKHLQQQKH